MSFECVDDSFRIKSEGRAEKHSPFRQTMADADMAASWKDAEKMLDKGKTEGALQLLRKADPDGTEVTTLRLAGKAIVTYVYVSFRVMLLIPQAAMAPDGSATLCRAEGSCSDVAAGARGRLINSS